MLHCFWYTLHDRCNSYFLFWANFSPFTLLATTKINFFKKMKKKKKTPGDTIILYICTKSNDHMMYSSWNFLCEGQMDRQTVGRTDRTNRQKKWHIEVGSKNCCNCYSLLNVLIISFLISYFSFRFYCTWWCQNIMKHFII